MMSTILILLTCFTIIVLFAFPELFYSLVKFLTKPFKKK